MDAVYSVCRVLQNISLKIFAEYSVEGRDHVPPRGPLIIVANHQSNVDPSLLVTSIPLRLRFLAKKSLFSGPVTKWFLKSYGAFPVNRTNSDMRAYKWVLSGLENGQAMVVFPEGTRSPGSMRKAHSGVVSLALKTQVSILPVGITGTENIGHWLSVINPTGKISIRIGTAFSLPSIDGKPPKEVLESLTDMVMSRVAALLPESYHGEYRITKARQHKSRS